MYGDTITESMRRTINETNRRREKQLAYNAAHGITPRQIQKAINETFLTSQQVNKSTSQQAYGLADSPTPRAAEDPILATMTAAQLEKSIARTRKLMQEAAAKLDFMQAAQYRDEMFRLEDLLKTKN